MQQDEEQKSSNSNSTRQKKLAGVPSLSSLSRVGSTERQKLSKQTNKKVMRKIINNKSGKNKMFFDAPESSEPKSSRTPSSKADVVAVKRKLGVKFQNVVKETFRTDKDKLSNILDAFRSSLAKPLKTSSISTNNPLHKDGHSESGWTFREVEK